MSFLAYHPLGPAEAQKLFHAPNPATDDAIAAFVARVRPEVLLISYSYDLVRNPLHLPRSRTPLPLVSLDVLPGRDPHTGIDQHTDFTAANAVDLVAEQILHGHTGLPERQKIVLTDGTWLAGTTCPPVRRRTAV